MVQPLRAICIYSRRYTPVNTSIATSFQQALRRCFIENWLVSDDSWDAARVALFQDALAQANLILVIADYALLYSKTWLEIAGLISVQMRADPLFRTIFFNLDLAPQERFCVPAGYAEWRPLRRLREPILSAIQLEEIERYFEQLSDNLPQSISAAIVSRDKRIRGEHELVMATCQLIVVRAVQLGWPLEELLHEHNISVSYLPCRWSSDVFRLIINGDVDLAIYNREASVEAHRVASDRIEILGNVGASMRGRHLYLLARNRALFGSSEVEIIRQLRGKSLAAPLATDIFDNMMILLGIKRDWLAANNVRLINISADADINELRAASADFVTGGQNIRFEAVSSGDYTEVMNSMTALKLSSTLMREKSVNCVVGNKEAISKVGHAIVANAVNTAWKVFVQRMNGAAFLEEICDKISEDVGHSISIETIKKIVRMSYA